MPLPLAAALLLATLPRAARALDNGLGATPAMGWSSWNTFRCDISASLILEVADAVVSSGLADAGYRYINVDDCWMRHGRDAAGHLVVDDDKFPDGMKALGDALHARGLLFGIYSAVRARARGAWRRGVTRAFACVR
jgi:alpha-galactosidase